jgi:hypothetical protein
MEKKDWRESVCRERAASTAMRSESTPRTDSGSMPHSPYSSPPGDEGTSAEDANANAYEPETDEMRCLLWAHGGQFHSAMKNASSGRPVFALIYRRVLFRERRSGKVRGALLGKYEPSFVL